MAKKIGLVLALDGESKFTQAMKNAQQASKQLDSSLKDLKSAYKDNATSMEYLTQRQDLLKQKEEAYQRTLTTAKTGQANAKKAYKEQAEALKELEKQLESAQNALSQMSKDDPGYAKQAQEVEKLNSALDKQTTYYLRAEGRLSSWDARVSKAQGDVNKNSTALEKNASDMQKSTSEAGKLADSMDDISDSADHATKGIGKLGENLAQAIAIKGVDMAGDAIKELGEKALEAAKYAVEVGSEYEAAMSEVSAISGATGNTLDTLSDKAKLLGRTTKFSASEVASAYKYMGMAGWDAGQMLSGVEGILNLAAAAGEELGTTSDIVTDDLTAFGMAAEDAGRMADVLAAASTNSNTNVSLLGETFKYAGSVAGAFGYTLEDVSVAAGLMANAGIKGSQAGTALRSIMTRLATDAGASATKLGALGTLTEKLGVEFYNADGSMRQFSDVLADTRKAWAGLTQEEQSNYANTIAGKNAMSGFLALMNAGEADFNKLTSAIANSDGAAKQMADTMQDNLKGAMTEFGSAAEGLGIAAYEKFSNALTGIVDFGTDILNKITDALTPDTKPLDDYVAAVQQAQKDVSGIEIAPNFSVMDLAEDDPMGLQKYLDGIIESGDAISEMALDPDVSGLEKYIKEVETAAKNLDVTRTAAKAYIEDSINQSAVIGALGDRLIRLNDIESKSNTQRYEMRTIVQELSQFIPELADAYDEESGSINKTTEEVEALIKAKQRQMIVDAQTAYQAEVAKDLYAAEAELMKAEQARAVAWQNQKAAEEHTKQLTDLHQRYTDLTDVINDTTAAEEEREAALQERAGIIKYAEDMNILVTSETSWQDAISDSINAEEKAKASHHEAYTAWRELRQGIGDTTEELGNQPEIINRVLEAMGLLEDETGSAAESMEESTEATEKSKEGLKQYAETIAGVAGLLKGMDETLGFTKALQEGAGAALAYLKETGEQVKAEMKHCEEIAASSAQNIRDAWANMVEDARGSINFNLFSDFEGGTDQTVEEMNAHMQSQIEGLQNYADNLQAVAQHVGKEISPEFMSYLEDMGTEGANVLQHIVKTLEQDNGSELLREWSDGYTQAMDMQDQIALIIAGDQAALTDGLRSLGSSDADFSELSAAVSSALSGVDDEVEQKIQGLVSTAQSVGATLPEGLADSIKSGDIDASGIERELNASIEGAMEGLLDVARESGADIPEGLAESIADGTADVQDAYDTLIQSIATSESTSSAISDAAKETFTTPLANGIAEGQEEVVAAVSGVTNAAAEAVKTDTEGFTEAGRQAASGYGKGIASGTQNAASAASDMGKAAVSAAGSSDIISGFDSVGLNMTAGIARGIAAGQSSVLTAMVTVAARALASAKAALGIRSPSKKFAREVGRQIPAGTAEGIKAAAKLSTAEAEKMSNSTLESATKWLQKYKKKNKVTKQDEQYFWAQMASVALQGSKSYEEAVSKGLSVGLSNNFGVKKTTTTGSGKNKKTVKKSAETYYSEVYQAAQDYYEMLTMTQDMSISTELAYWQKVQQNLKKGTTAYVQAAQKIKSIKEQIGGFDVASDILDSFQVYQEMSEKAVMDYWDLIRQQYEIGTEDRIKADAKYYDAHKKYTEKLKSIDDEYAQNREELEQKLTDAINERTKAIADAYDLFDEYTSESDTGQQLLFNIKSQAKGYQFWADQLKALEERGILSSDLMDALKEKGPNESAAIYAINSLSDEELAEYNRAYQQKMDLARRQAAEDESDLASQISKELESLTSTYSDDIASVNANLNTEMASLAQNIQSIASDQTAQIVSAIAGSGQSAAQAIATAQATSTAAAAAQQAAEAAQQAAAEKAEWENKIKAVVSAGKKTSKTSDSYNDLRNYVISRFGYDIGAIENNELYKKLGNLFGISVSKTSTGAQRTAIRRAIQAKGFRTGTKRVPVWMDEDGPGSEMVVSRTDNAILTRVPAGSAIYPANLTDNLWQWGEFAPAQFLAQMDRRQAAMTAYVNDIVGSVNIASLNNRLAVSEPRVIGGSSGDAALLTSIVDLLSRYLPEIEESRNTYLDKDLVTRSMSDNMSREMALRSRRIRQ